MNYHLLMNKVQLQFIMIGIDFCLFHFPTKHMYYSEWFSQ